MVWPCPGGISDGDTLTIIVKRIDIDRLTSYFSFTFKDTNTRSLNCIFSFDSLGLYDSVPLDRNVSLSDFIVEQGTSCPTGPSVDCSTAPSPPPPSPTPFCTGFVGGNPYECELPAWEPAINQTGGV